MYKIRPPKSNVTSHQKDFPAFMFQIKTLQHKAASPEFPLIYNKVD